MRLIETHKLKKEMFDTCRKNKNSYLSKLQVLIAINNCEEVEAIPIKFIEDQMKTYRIEKDFDHVDCLFDLIESWREEKE